MNHTILTTRSMPKPDVLCIIPYADIDAAVARKEAALDAYRKEAEAARKEEAAAKKRAAADAAGLRHSSGKAAAGAATGLRK